jgi:hypothetical protein
MESLFKKSNLKVIFVLALFFILFGKDGLAGEPKNDVATAAKEAQSVGVPAPVLNRLLAIGYEYQVDSKTMTGFIKTLMEIWREEIPLSPFTNKIEEGLVKHAPSAVIQQVMQKKLDDYRFTRTLVREILKKRGQGPETIPFDFLQRLSESISCGISKENLRSLIEQAPPASPPSILVLAVETEASLEQNQFDSPTARQIVLLGLKHQFFTPEKGEFPRVILAARKKGVPLQKISSITMEVIQKGLSLQSLASRLQVTAGDISHGPIVRPGISDGSGGPKGGRTGSGLRGGSSGDGHGPGPGVGGPGGGGPGGAGPSGGGPGGAGGGPGGGGVR